MLNNHTHTYPTCVYLFFFFEEGYQGSCVQWDTSAEWRRNLEVTEPLILCFLSDLIITGLLPSPLHLLQAGLSPLSSPSSPSLPSVDFRSFCYFLVIAHPVFPCSFFCCFSPPPPPQKKSHYHQHPRNESARLYWLPEVQTFLFSHVRCKWPRCWVTLSYTHPELTPVHCPPPPLSPLIPLSCLRKLSTWLHSCMSHCLCSLHPPPTPHFFSLLPISCWISSPSLFSCSYDVSRCLPVRAPPSLWRSVPVPWISFRPHTFSGAFFCV